jgi:hypothetical protein
MGSGWLSCNTNNCTVNTSQCGNDPDGGVSACGDGVVGPGELCDPGVQTGYNCAIFGMGTGPISCDPISCTFDTSMCSANGGGVGGMGG